MHKLAGSLARGLWREDGTLRQKAVRSGFWVMGSMAVTRILGMVQTIILVRLLVPQDFGIMRVAGVVLGAVETFTEAGIAAALVQRKNVTKETLHTAWTVQFLRQIALFVAVLLLAPWAASFYGNAMICPILQLVAFRFLFSAFESIGVVLLRKELRFRRHEIFEMTSNLFSIVLTVVAAFALRSVWALAVGQVAFACIRLIGSYIVYPYRPRLSFKWAEAKGLLGFGVNLTGMGILVFLSGQGDSALVGKVAGLTALGYYTLALALSNLPVTCVAHVLSTVALPAYSKLQEDIERLGSAFCRSLTIVSWLVVPASVGLYIVAPDLVAIVYGRRYLPMVACFRVVTLYGLFRGLLAPLGPLFMATGKPRLALMIQLIRFVVLAALIYPLTAKWGITGAALATVVSMATCTAWAFWRASGILGHGVLQTWFRSMPSVVAAASVMAALVCLLQGAGLSGSAFGLLAKVGAGALSYGAAMALLVSELRVKARGIFLQVAGLGTTSGSAK